MSRQDTNGDASASSSGDPRSVIRRIGPDSAPAPAEASGETPAAPQKPAYRSSVIKRITPPAVSPDAPERIDSRNFVLSPDVDLVDLLESMEAGTKPTLLPPWVEGEIEERRRAVIRPIAREHPSAVPTYSEGGEAQVKKPAPGPNICRHCATRNRDTAMFCSVCGAALPPVRGLPNSLKQETERLQREDEKRERLIGTLHGNARTTSWRAAGVTHPGRVRMNNEDTLLAEKFPGNGWLLIVADGMGGAEAGEVASNVTATLVRELVETRLAHDSALTVDRRPWMAEAIEQANLLLHRHAEEDPALSGMGTTIVVALVQGQTLEIAHVGDSRIYLLPPGKALEQLTVDHSIVAHLMRIGQLTPEEAINHPLSSQLYRAVAANATIEVDTAVHELLPGSKIMLCSDGLTLHVADAEIEESLRWASAPEDVCNQLLALALARGGEDNVTLITLMQS